MFYSAFVAAAGLHLTSTHVLINEAAQLQERKGVNSFHFPGFLLQLIMKCDAIVCKLNEYYNMLYE